MTCLCFIMAKLFNFVVSANHISGVYNQLAADGLSRNNCVQFLRIYPQAAPQPSAASPALLDLLITSKPDLLSQHWTNLWKTIFRQHSLPAHSESTPLHKTTIAFLCFTFPATYLYQFQNTNVAAHLADETISHTTIKSYLSAIRHLQIASNLPDPNIANMPKPEGVMKGIKSLQAKSQPNKRTRLPITPAIMLQLWEQQSADKGYGRW